MRRLGGIVLLLIVSACSTADGPADPRTAAERAAPDLAEWRSGAADIAKALAKRLPGGSTVMLSVEGGEAPDYFADLLTQELLGHDVHVASGAEGSREGISALRCRTAPVGVVSRPRGMVAMAEGSGGIAVFCSVSRDGGYLAAVDRLMPIKPLAAATEDGAVLRVTQ